MGLNTVLDLQSRLNGIYNVSIIFIFAIMSFGACLLSTFFSVEQERNMDSNYYVSGAKQYNRRCALCRFVIVWCCCKFCYPVSYPIVLLLTRISFERNSWYVFIIQ